MSQVDAPNTTTTSRRLFLAAGSAAAVFSTLSIAVAETHPDAALLDAVNRQIAAEKEYNACCQLDDDHPDLDRLSDESSAQFEIALSLPSKTKDGLRAKALLLKRWNSGRTPDVVSPFADQGEQLAWSLANEILAL